VTESSNTVCNRRMLCQCIFSVRLSCVYWTYSILTLNQWFNFYDVISAHVSHDHPVATGSQSQMVSHYWISLPNEKMVQFYIHDIAGLGLLLWRTEGVMHLKDIIVLYCTANGGSIACGLNTLCRTSCGEPQDAPANSKRCGGYPKLAEVYITVS
jgi:hypothetical protein